MAGNGLWAKLSCEEISDGKSGTDIIVAGSTRPTEAQGGGTTTTINGAMDEKGNIDGYMTEVDTSNGILTTSRADGTQLITYPSSDGRLPVDVESSRRTAVQVDNNIRPVAQGCKALLAKVPGAAG